MAVTTSKSEGLGSPPGFLHDPAIDDPAASGTVFNWLDREFLLPPESLKRIPIGVAPVLFQNSAELHVMSSTSTYGFGRR